MDRYRAFTQASIAYPIGSVHCVIHSRFFAFSAGNHCRYAGLATDGIHRQHPWLPIPACRTCTTVAQSLWTDTVNETGHFLGDLTNVLTRFGPVRFLRSRSGIITEIRGLGHRRYSPPTSVVAFLPQEYIRFSSSRGPSPMSADH